MESGLHCKSYLQKVLIHDSNRNTNPKVLLYGSVILMTPAMANTMLKLIYGANIWSSISHQFNRR